MTNPEILGIIQVRMGSQRLPGKALRILGDEPLLAWVVRRVKLSKRVHRWVVATSTDPHCDAIEELCKSLGVEVFRGSETDVLSRFVECVKLYRPKYVIRVCADNPLVWGPLVDDLINQVSDGDVYLANHRSHTYCCVADGFGAELIDAQRLIEVSEKSPSISDKEHVTASISELHARRRVTVDSELRHPYFKFDIDTFDDFRKIEKLITLNGISFSSDPIAIVKVVLGDELQEMLTELFPLNRSLAGEMNRRTLEIIEKTVPLCRHQIESGAEVFDWIVPPEWSIAQGYIENRSGERLIDINRNQLHVVSYSTAVDKVVDLSELRSHLHVHPTLEAIPYRTSYYHRDWGFCITPSQLRILEHDAGPFRVVIESTLINGVLDFADLVKTGSSSREILISCYFCHPSLANDSLSGVVLTTLLARYLASQNSLRYTYRIVFVPETIGALVLLDSLGDSVENIFCGLQITTVGGPGSYQIKQSWNPDHPINYITKKVVESSGVEYQEVQFDIHGSDERQYSSPGFRINMVTVARDIYYSYPEYHSSLDNLDLVKGEQIAETFGLYVRLIAELETRRVFTRVEPRGEPMLSRHNLDEEIGGSFIPGSTMSDLDVALWVLFLSDGEFSTEDIGRKIGLSNHEVLSMCERLTRLNLLRET